MIILVPPMLYRVMNKKMADYMENYMGATDLYAGQEVVTPIDTTP